MREHSEIIGVSISMSYENYDDVRSQLMDAGLLLDGELKVGGGKSSRCKVEGRGREKRGWYWLHEAAIDGKYYLIGSYGVYEGTDPGTQKIQLTKRCDSCRREVSFKEKKCPHCETKLNSRELSNEQRVAHRARIAEDVRHEKARRQAEADRAARRACAAWAKCTPAEAHPYLTTKAVMAHKVRVSPRGNLVIPMCDEHGNIHGLQIIYVDPETKKRKGRDRDYWPTGLAKQGRSFLLGTPGPVILIVEGYATGSSVHEATGLPVAIAFDAGNLLAAAQVIHHRWRSARLLICADDDALGRCRGCQKLTPQPAPTCAHCGADTSVLANTGVTMASAAALAVGGAWVTPQFTDRGMRKLSDFNDLQHETTQGTVRTQIEAKLYALGWHALRADDSADSGTLANPFALSLDGLVQHLTLIYSTETTFDNLRKSIISLASARAVYGRSLMRMWQEHQDRRTVLPHQVVFDPSEQSDPATTCNLWGGWPTRPRTGNCTLWVELLEYLTSNDDKPRELFHWVVKWIAYSVQNPGAKMATAIMVLGPEGSGKNMVFGGVRQIYGRYGGIFSQTELESKFNGYLSGKLFLIGNEVLSPAERYHLQGAMKNMVTEGEIQINEKNLPSRLEQNHCNFVFLSNRTNIAKLDRDDRRYCVFWTPPPLSKEFYAAVAEEMQSGGVEALHDYLLNLDLGDFGPHTPPPLTRAKRELIDLSLDSSEAFFVAWSSGHLEVPFAPCRTENLYEAYRIWANKVGVSRAAPLATLIANLIKKPELKHKRAHHYKPGTSKEIQSSVLIPRSYQAPEGENEISWLSDCIDKFNEAVVAWREGDR